MSRVKRLARMNECCDQVAPVPLIPRCAIQWYPPTPKYIPSGPCYPAPAPPPPAIPTEEEEEAARRYYDYIRYVEPFKCKDKRPKPAKENLKPPSKPVCSTCNMAQCSCNKTNTTHQVQQLNEIRAYPMEGTVTPGTILTYSGFIAPPGYLIADGSELSRTKYAALFNVIKGSYGKGDGSRTFNLPNRPRFADNVNNVFTVITYIIKT